MKHMPGYMTAEECQRLPRPSQCRIPPAVCFAVGRLVAFFGSPIPGITVTVTEGGIGNSTTLTDADGRFKIRVKCRHCVRLSFMAGPIPLRPSIDRKCSNKRYKDFGDIVILGP